MVIYVSLCLYYFLCVWSSGRTDQAVYDFSSGPDGDYIKDSAIPANLINLGQQRHFMGDIVLRHKQRNGIPASRRWPNGKIYYEFGGPYSDEEIELILSCMRRIEQHTCVRFLERTDEPNYVYIINTDEGCYSAGVGEVGGMQELSLQSSPQATCISTGIITHELLHIVGLWHEHVRADRDTYVNIRWDNVRPGLESQFTVLDPSQTSIYSLPYDYYSVMHYDAYAFSNDRGGFTIEPRDGRFLPVIGRVKEPSFTDYEKVRRIYGCSSSVYEGDGSGIDQNVPGDYQAQGPLCVNDAVNCWLFKRKCRVWPSLKNHCRLTCGYCDGVQQW